MMVDELVRAAAGGDEDAFAQLVALHEKKVYNLALRMCGDPEDAWDAAQEAFLSAWRGLPSFRGGGGLFHLALPPDQQRGHRPAAPEQAPAGGSQPGR